MAAKIGVGSPGSARLGAGLYLGGLALGAVALGVFLWSAALKADDPAFWHAREAAFGLAAVGLPAFLTGVALLLQSDRRSTLAAGVGGVLCLGAVAMFVRSYPAGWDLSRAADATVPAIVLYAAGLAAITGSTWQGLRGTVAARNEHGDPAPAPAGDARSHRMETGPADPSDREPTAATRSSEADGAPVEDLESDCLRRLFRDHENDR